METLMSTGQTATAHHRADTKTRQRKHGMIVYTLLALLATACSPSAKEAESRVVNLINMSELGTVEYTVQKMVKVDDQQKWSLGDRKILFSVTAYLKAGIDMSQVEVEPDGKSVTVSLPHAKLVSFNMPAEEITTEFEHYGTLRSRFDADQQNMLLQQAEADIRNEVPNFGILEDAERNVTELLTAILRQMGYTDIDIKFV